MMVGFGVSVFWMKLSLHCCARCDPLVTKSDPLVIAGVSFLAGGVSLGSAV